MTRDELAPLIDHTLLDPAATAAEVRALAREGAELGVAAICVSPSLVAAAGEVAAGADPAIAAVVGFPSGAHLPALKAAEAERACADGAAEIDMVIDLGRAREGSWDLVAVEVAAVRAAVGPAVTLKAIVEAALLDREQIVAACRAVERGGADFVKTSTGFCPAGGATVAAVATMKEAVGDRLRIKAAGGIRDAGSAERLIEAGATRLGMSRTAAVLAELD
jgi:deoxyribose-phosphate aldolase